MRTHTHAARWPVVAFAAGAVALLISAPAVGDDRQVPIGRFDAADALPVVRHAKAAIAGKAPAPAQGAGCLRIEPADGKGRPLVIIDLPETLNLADQCRLLGQVHVPEGATPVKLRWWAVDGENRIIMQRRDAIDRAGWSRFELPLRLWRWGNSYVGDWSDVRRLALRVESDTPRLALDDLRFAGDPNRPGQAVLDAKWYLDLAFGDRRHRATQKEGLLVATDAVAELSDADLEAIAARLARARHWVRRVFAEVRRPMLHGQPVVLLIFAEDGQYKAFHDRLGEQWRVAIHPPGSAGYTVQDITSATYSRRHGADRPVWFHEAVHAFVTRELRVMTGVKAHSWLHEALANYLQLCVYPESLKRSSYVRHFARPIDERSFFRPLAELLTRRARSKHYAQLASLAAFLVEEHPDWLCRLAVGLADGEPIQDILDDCGTSFEDLQKRWLAWGRKAFAPDADPPAGPGTHFKTPREWSPKGTER